MKDYIDLDKLKENSSKYQKLITKQQFSSNILSFFEVVKQELADDLNCLLVTNKDKNLHSNGFYSLKISKSTVDLIEETQHLKNHIILTFDPPTLYLNNRKMGSAYSRAFGMRIREIISDIKRNQCFVFEDPS